MVKVLDTILSQSAYSAEIDVPFEKIDIVDWLFNLPEAEYLRCCPPDHIAAGVTWTDDGRRMLINVEQIGSGLVVQHYVAEVAEPTYCRMNSISDVFTAYGREPRSMSSGNFLLRRSTIAGRATPTGSQPIRRMRS